MEECAFDALARHLLRLSKMRSSVSARTMRALGNIAQDQKSRLAASCRRHTFRELVVGHPLVEVDSLEVISYLKLSGSRQSSRPSAVCA